jgi:hypothetical protein
LCMEAFYGEVNPDMVRSTCITLVST